MIRSLFLGLLLAVPLHAVPLFPPSWSPVQIGTWGGLNLLNDSTAIGNDGQKAQNVITDNGYLEKRPGNVLLTTIDAGSPKKYVDDWVAPNGSRYLLAHSSNSIYQTDFSTSAVVLGTVTAGYSINSLSQFSRRYFADGNVPPWYWDGSSTSTLVSDNGTAAPICTFMAAKDSRVFCANIPNEGRSRVRISSTGGAGYWVVPPDVAFVDNAPNVFDFTPDDGDSIQCMATTPWGVFVGKRYSSWMIKGTGNLSYELRILDPKIGCIDNRSVQMVNGVLQWLSLNGVYGFTGGGPVGLLSRDLDPLLRNLSASTARAQEWRVDTQLEWRDGNLTASGPGAPISANISPGSIVGSTAGLVDQSSSNFVAGTLLASLTTSYIDGSIQLSSSVFLIRNGDFATGDTTDWTCSAAGGSSACGYLGGVGYAYAGVNGGVPSSAIKLLDENNNVLYTDGGVGQATCDTGYFDLNALGLSTQTIKIGFYGNGNGTAASIISSTFTSVSSVSFNCTYVNSGGGSFGNIGYSAVDNVKINRYFALQQTSATPVNFISRIFDTGLSTPTGGSFLAWVSSNTGTALAFAVRSSTSPNNDLWTAFQSISTGTKIPLTTQYWQYESTFTTSVGTTSPRIDQVSMLAATTGYYDSAVHFIGSAITSYGNFIVTQALPNGATNTFQIRAASYTFTDASSLPWISQTANQMVNLTVSSPTFVQWRVLIDFNNADNAPRIERVAINWNEGNYQPVASGVDNRRYFLCLTISTTATNNDTCIIRQQNGKWVTWAGPSIGSMGMYDNNLIIGDGSTSGKIWKVMQSGVYSDDATAIDSQWVSADYTNGVIFNDKVLHEMWVDAMPTALSSVTVSYQVNKSSAFVDYQFYLDNGQPVNPNLTPIGMALYGQINKFIPLGNGYDVGKYVRFKFSDSILGNYWRINNFLAYIENEGRQIP